MKGNPELWPARERKAIWAKKHFGFGPDTKIADLGCGDGMLDIWLCRMGYDVTAVDRNSNVLEIAKITDDTKKVKFISSDLLDVQLDQESFDGVMIIEAVGLMSRFKELQIFKNIYSWLKPGGKFIIDSPKVFEISNSWTKEFPNGTARGVSGFDEVSRLQNIQFYFNPHGEAEFGIYDPYDLGKGNVPGIMRYIYPKEELTQILQSVGFETEAMGHYYEKNFYGLLCKKHS